MGRRKTLEVGSRGSGGRPGWGLWAAAALVAVLAAVAIVGWYGGDSNEEPGTAEFRAAAGITREVIGESLQGREIESYAMGSGDRMVVVIGGLHTGNEIETVEVAQGLLEHFQRSLRDLPDGVRLVIVPLANPDGAADGMRTNAADVDLNRNWPTEDWSAWAIHGDEEVSGGDAPGSEPETQALLEHLRALRPDFVVSLHGYAGVVHHNGEGQASRLARTYARSAGYDSTDEWEHYEVTGELIGWLREEGIAGADVELSGEERDAVATNLRGLLAVLQDLAEG